MKTYDVAVLGTGMAGSMLGAILARHGASVLLIDNSNHPRFAVGESTVPLTSRMMITIANRYDIPEVRHLSTFEGIKKHVTRSCGVKRNFGFVLHHLDGAQHPDETTQMVIPGNLIDYETHLFRQDVDAYMLHVAVKYGAHTRQLTTINNVEFDDQSVQLRATSGEAFQARYLVDAGGFRSPLAQKFGLRENPSRLKHHSRSLFTHMVDVKRYDDCIHPRGAHNNPSPWAEGTLHHMFDGGWIWVIPFDNHNDSTNPLCSVGLTIDHRKYPKTDINPNEEFFAWVNKFPSVAEQFRSAKATREWVSTDRLQFSSRQIVGDRYCLMAHASGFIDPLFSRGLANTSDVVNSLAWRLLKALVDGDFSRERFLFLETLQQSLLNYNDQLVNCAFIAFSDFNLWNAWFRIWAVGQALGEVRVIFANLKYKETRDPAVFDELEEVDHPGLLFPILDTYKSVWDKAVEAVEAVGSDEISSQEGARRVWSLIDAHFSDPSFMNVNVRTNRHFRMTPTVGLKGVTWLMAQPPSDFRAFLLGGLSLMTRTWLKGQRL